MLCIRPKVVAAFPASSLTKSILPITSLVAGLAPFLLNLRVALLPSAFVLSSCRTGLADVLLSILISEPVKTKSSSPLSSYFIDQSESEPKISDSLSTIIKSSLSLK